MQVDYIGVDIGTTGVKAVVFDETGNERYKAYETYPMQSPSPDAAEQDPDLIYKKTISVLEQAIVFSNEDVNELRAVSFSSAMHSMMCVDDKGLPLTNLITWADKRSSAETKALQHSESGQQFYERTGTPIHPMSPFAKLLWMKTHEPTLLESTAKVIGIKEYIFYHLFGEFVMDESIASATGLMNIHEREWDEEIVSYAGITTEQLPELVPTSFTFYRDNIPYIIGASDGVLSNLGVGAINEGEVALTIGTSAAIRSASSTPHVDAKGRTFCYLLTDDLWIIGGPINNGGIALQWVVEELVKDENISSDQAVEAVLTLADRVPAGSNGLFFIPFLTGERAPLWNPEATASYIGLTRTHTREDMIRAALEGVTFNIYSVLLALQELIGFPGSIYASGGFSRSETWKQMAADIFDQPLHFAKSYESSALGAVILSMYTLGDIESLSHFKQHQHVDEKVVPDETSASLYRDYSSLYLELIRSLSPHYERLYALQQKEGVRI
ncbi:hypothetical protein DH09_13925 [Bacillaceae bacterium JMAK1]|nr:hypothetical protein DH09_13925 [Bacillaceae bacterium JMAK1]